MEFRKMVTITLCMRQQKRHWCIGQFYGLCGEGEGGEIWENGIETCKISCMKRDASPGLMHDTGCLGLVHWDDPEGWYGEGGGRRVQDGEHMYTYGRKFIKFIIKKKEINSVCFIIKCPKTLSRRILVCLTWRCLYYWLCKIQNWIQC